MLHCFISGYKGVLLTSVWLPIGWLMPSICILCASSTLKECLHALVMVQCMRGSHHYFGMCVAVCQNRVIHASHSGAQGSGPDPVLPVGWVILVCSVPLCENRMCVSVWKKSQEKCFFEAVFCLCLNQHNDYKIMAFYTIMVNNNFVLACGWIENHYSLLKHCNWMFLSLLCYWKFYWFWFISLLRENKVSTQSTQLKW